jgi:hypothetical protein
MQSERERRLARLGDGNQAPSGLLDNVFPALCICDRLLGHRTSNTPDHGTPDRAQRSRHWAARRLCPSDAADGTTGGRTDRAIRAYQHPPHANNHPTLHCRLLLCGGGGIGVGGVALAASGEGEREEPREQQKGQSNAAQGKVPLFVSGRVRIAVETLAVRFGIRVKVVTSQQPSWQRPQHRKPLRPPSSSSSESEDTHRFSISVLCHPLIRPIALG